MKEEIHMELTALQTILGQRFGGVITAGQHAADGQACAMELAHAVHGDLWSDVPDYWPDFRPLNDAPCWSSDQARTAALLPVLAAVWDWEIWPAARQRAFAATVALRTVRELVLVARSATGLEEEAAVSEAAHSLTDASAASDASDAAAAAAYASDASTDAAYDVDASTDAYAADAVLRQACRIWVEAATT